MRVARSKGDEIEQAWPGAPMVGLLRSGRDPLLTPTEFRGVTELIGEPLLLVDRIADHLDRLAAGDRLLIAVDDVQWADRISRYGLRTLISRLVGRPVVWVLASRSDDLGLTVSGPDGVGVEHIRLGPLAPSDVVEIARDRLGPRFDGRVAELLAAAGGNAFFATQIIDGVARGGQPDGQAPAEFMAAVRHRLAGLSASARRLIDVVAAAHARAAVSVGDEANAAIMVTAAEALVTTSAVDAAELALHAFQTLRFGQPRWLELGQRALSVLSRTQRAADTIAVADLLLATVDDPDTISRIETQAAKAMWLTGRFPELVQRATATSPALQGGVVWWPDFRRCAPWRTPGCFQPTRPPRRPMRRWPEPGRQVIATPWRSHWRPPVKPPTVSVVISWHASIFASCAR